MNLLVEAGGDLVQDSVLSFIGTFCFGPIWLLLKATWARRMVKIALKINALFNEAKEEAKIAGKLLACCFALRYPFPSQALSMVGFSLGCQVTKTCMKTLHFLEALSLMQNVTFLAGAMSKLDKDARTKAFWAEIFSKSVNGEVRNVYTKKDFTLILFSISQLRWSAGRDQSLEIVDEGADCLNTAWKDDQAMHQYPLVWLRMGVYRFTNHNIFYLQSDNNNLIIGFIDNDN